MDLPAYASDRFPASAGLAPTGWRPGLFVWLVLYVVVSIAVFGGIAAYVIETRLSSRDARQGELLRELEAREAARLAMAGRLEALERQLGETSAVLREADAERDRLAQALDQAILENQTLEAERQRARQRARALDRSTRQTAFWLETAERERLIVERERALLEHRLAAAETARAQAEAAQARLRWRLEGAEARVSRLETEQAQAARWLADWIEDRLGAIETVLQQTGIEPGRMLARLIDGEELGRGGPYVPAPDELRPRQLPGPGAPAAILGLDEPAAAALGQDLDRLAAAHRLLAAVPLAAPLDHFHLTSRFGPRIDPLTGRRAIHGGLDFAAAAGSEVLAAAPGRVTHAGRAGSYGIMVEIDHGQGITTRYAHLSRALVTVGDEVAFRRPIGVIGSTGRSTGRHLHYEVRLDDEPRDPARFIAAGRQLIKALGS